MYDIESLNQEISTLGSLSYSGHPGESTDRWIFIIEEFTPSEEKIASFYSIVGKYLTDMEIFTFYSSPISNSLKCELKKIE